jgi:hypothetical protein
MSDTLQFVVGRVGATIDKLKEALIKPRAPRAKENPTDDDLITDKPDPRPSL